MNSATKKNDLEILEEIKKIYLEQDDPINGWWFTKLYDQEGNVIGPRSYFKNSCYCFEGCFGLAIGMSDFELSKMYHIMSDYETRENHIQLNSYPLYKKLLEAASFVMPGKTPLSEFHRLYMYNSDKSKVIEILDEAIRREKNV